jgi:exonuclease III
LIAAAKLWRIMGQQRFLELACGKAPHVKLLAWNIQQGGAKRADAILSVIVQHAPDVLVLTELRRSSAAILSALAERGWKYQVTGLAESPVAAPGILARDPFVELPPAEPTTVLPGRWIEVSFVKSGMVVAAVYGPLRNEPHDAFWRAAERCLPARVQGTYLIAGDLNTGESLLDAASAHFFCSEHFLKLRSAGLIDIWRQRNTGAREYSYHHRRRGGIRGAGFRLDHVLASPTLAAASLTCGYDRAALETNVSDHAPTYVEFDLPAL